MKDPQRLLEHGASELELALLRAGAVEEPSDAARQRLLANLGVSGALASAALAESAVAHAGTHGTGAGAGGSGLKLVVAKLGAKGLALALGSASVLGGVWVTTQLPARQPAPRAAVYEAMSAPRPAPRAEPESASPGGENAQEAARATPHEAPQVEAPSASLAGEIAQLDRARSLLRAGDAQAAARVLDRYAAEQPRGALRQEADVLRIDVHWQLGEPARARHLSRVFLRAYAASPHAERVRARLEAHAR